jgi:hypothetical protein
VSAPTASVVIPAHDEERGLRRCLSALLAGASTGEFDVVVVANGCTDGTATTARDFSDRGVRCIETAEASKIAALRLGDKASTVFPRIYLDADVVVTTDAARALVDTLSTTPALAAAPRLRLDLSRAGRLARLYLRAWEALPVFDRHYVGSGCYALSQTGHDRFGVFPDVMSDDQFVNDLFSPSEKVTLIAHHLWVTSPATLRGIVRRSLRVRAGRLQLHHDDLGLPMPAGAPTDRTASSGGTGQWLLTSVARSPGRAPSVVTFAVVQVVIALAARMRRLRATDRTWLRDETSRSSAS